ncbi:MAG: TIGR00282 family metallophosphoesterase [bacterium]
MRLLFIGDIIGEPGRKKVVQMLPEIVKNEKIFFTVAQGENLAGGIGITEGTARELFDCGVDCITTGNHVWKYKEIHKYLDTEEKLLRPANYPDGVPGRGSFVYEKAGIKIGVINLEGRVFMKCIEDPFRVGKSIIQEMLKQTSNIFIDFHAEATAEKKALAFFLCGYATAIIGTHTHIQTADEQIIDSHCAYITDVGMVGSADSIIGVKREEVVRHFLYNLPVKFRVAKENIVANSVVIDFDETKGMAKAIFRLTF